MVRVNNIFNNSNLKCIAKEGIYSVYEHQNDLSVTPLTAENAYFMSEMNVKKRQVLCELENTSIKVQAGAMQWQTGNISMNSDVSGVGDFFGKMIKGAVTGESAVKPIFNGTGYMMLEPTYNHIIIENISDWGGGIVLDDGLFLACDANLNESIVSRSNLATAALGGEGLFNLTLSGNGFCVLESPVPREELFEFVLDNDVIKIDGNMAIAWSSSLEFTTEKSTSSLVGSVLSGEGFVNVYRGTGRVLMAPTLPGTTMSDKHAPEQTTANTSAGAVGNFLGGLLK